LVKRLTPVKTGRLSSLEQENKTKGKLSLKKAAFIVCFFPSIFGGKGKSSFGYKGNSPRFLS
jgi:hypothetical protein